MWVRARCKDSGALDKGMQTVTTATKGTVKDLSYRVINLFLERALVVALWKTTQVCLNHGDRNQEILKNGWNLPINLSMSKSREKYRLDTKLCFLYSSLRSCRISTQ